MYIAGMDIGGTKCASILAEMTKESVRFLNRTEFPTGGGWKNVLERLAADLEKMRKKREYRSLTLLPWESPAAGRWTRNGG